MAELMAFSNLSPDERERFCYSVDVHSDDLDELGDKWCQEEADGRWTWISKKWISKKRTGIVTEIYTYLFEVETDAAMFRLRFG